MYGFLMLGRMPRRLAEGAMCSACAAREVMRSFRLNHHAETDTAVHASMAATNAPIAVVDTTT
jgi:hypothetical protein